MRIGITGSSGLVGTALRTRLQAEGHETVRFVRGASTNPAATWDPQNGWVRPGVLDELDVVVHLAGESIGDARWSDARKRDLQSSRIDATRLLVSEIRKANAAPVLISASAIGYYGNRGDEELTESSSKGDGFLADLSAAWEAEALKAEGSAPRVAVLRFGVILSAGGGALPRMALPFKFGAGGRLGGGRQWCSWVALDDVVSVIVRAIGSDMRGIYNVTAPSPVTNAELTKVLAKTLHRPALFPVPPFALRALLGESADELLLASQRVMPKRLLENGFTFLYPELAAALTAELGTKTRAA